MSHVTRDVSARHARHNSCGIVVAVQTVHMGKFKLI